MNNMYDRRVITILLVSEISKFDISLTYHILITLLIPSPASTHIFFKSQESLFLSLNRLSRLLKNICVDQPYKNQNQEVTLYNLNETK